MILQIRNDSLRSVYNTYSERINEAEEYISFLESMHSNILPNFIKMKERSKTTESEVHVSHELKSTMNAASYLILYNIIESTITGIIDTIHQDILINNIQHHQLTDELYRVFLKNFSKYLSDAKIRALINDNASAGSDNDMYLRILSLGYDKTNLFNGNIDYRKVKETANFYGFNAPLLNDDSSIDILLIKFQRNNLAHGSESFSECGEKILLVPEAPLVKERLIIDGEEKEVNKTTIRNKFDSMKNLLDGLFQNLDNYLSNQLYLK